MEIIQRAVFAGREGGGEGLQSTGDFSSSGNTLDDIIMTIRTCVIPRKYTTPRVEPNVI